MRQLGWDEEHDWENSTDIRGINIDGKVLRNLRFADDIVLFSSSTTELSSMLNDLDEVGKKIGLKMNVKKTQWMKNRFCDQSKGTVEGRDLQEVTSYIYLGREVNMVNDLQAEIGRRETRWMDRLQLHQRSHQPAEKPETASSQVSFH
ncbi:unnamed protein product [Caenorhabditis auriculariae]|uniref:Reverse transcriptase domain-containing protein n=1 Tax=Caenorhabditis auriculariae TaxID=2777116 RepID=A0A8S1HM03_9PELO|nr:unnamed protein product [Caenorhabditis auriculariae]